MRGPQPGEIRPMGRGLEEVTRPPQVAIELDMLNGSINELESLANDLEKKLEPVISRIPMTSGAMKELIDEKELVPVAKHIRESRDRIGKISGLIHYLIKTVQI